MLRKLLKYDLGNICKFLVIFYGLAIFFSLLTRLFFSIENSLIMNIIAQVCSGITISMIFNILINNLMRLWVRFKQNFYGDEAYLTHTLPIEKKTLYLSKFITAITSLFASSFVIGLTIVIAYYSKENLIWIKNLLLPLADLYDSSIIGLILIILVVFFLEMANLLQVGFTGIILGHQRDNKKIVFSIIYGFITYMAIQILVLFSMFVLALFDSNIMNLFVTNQILDLSSLKTLMYIAIIIYSLAIIAIYFINIKLFNKGVNVE